MKTDEQIDLLEKAMEHEQSSLIRLLVRFLCEKVDTDNFKTLARIVGWPDECLTVLCADLFNALDEFAKTNYKVLLSSSATRKRPRPLEPDTSADGTDGAKRIRTS